MTFSHDDPLAWLVRVLWPDGSAAVRPGAPRDAAGGPSWWASPTADAPHVMIPTWPRSAVRGAVRRYHDGQPPARRARSALAEALARSGPLGDRLLGGRTVHLEGDPHGGVPGAVAAALRIGELSYAVSLAQVKSNRKPVLQLFDGAGRCVGFAKVGWDEHTVELVDNEARWLRRRPQEPLSTPVVLADFEAHGRRIVVQTALRGARLPRRRITTPPSAEVFGRVVELGTCTSVPLSHSPWWRSVENAAAAAGDREAAVVAALGSDLGATVVPIGAWHGDLTPWNLLSGRRLVHLIDWEFAADGVPVGFDLCHFHVQTGVELLGLDAGAALERAAVRVEDAIAPAVWRCYLLELVRRRIELSRAGWPVERVHLGRAALEVLCPSDTRPHREIPT